MPADQTTNEIKPEFLPENLPTGRLAERAGPLKFEGNGTNNAVFASEKLPGRVIKVEMHAALLLAKELLSGNKNIEAINKQVKEYLAREKKRLEELTEHFGSEHIPKQKKRFMKVPMSKFWLKIFNENAYNKNILSEEEISKFEGTEMKTLVSDQEEVPELKQKGTLSFATGFPETGRHSNKKDDEEKRGNEIRAKLGIEQQEETEEEKNEREKFQKAYNKTTAFALGKNLKEPLSINDLRNTQHSMEPLLETMTIDESVKKSVKDFVTKAVAYSTKTGCILDTAGKGNAIFFKDKEGTWQYKMPDALYPTEEPGTVIQRARETLAKINSDQQLNQKERNNLRDVLNYARTMNCLAEFLGVEGRVNLLEEGTDIEVSKIWEALSSTPPSVSQPS